MDAFGQLDRAEGAVEPQHVYIAKRDHRGHECFRVAAGEHVRAVVQIKTCLHHQGHLPAGFFHRQAGGVDGALDAQQILHRFDQDDIGPAGEQAAHLLGVTVEHHVPRHVPEADEFCSRADRSDHIARAVGRFKLVAGAPGKLGGDAVYFEALVAQISFGKHQFHSAERVGFDGIATYFEKCFMNLLNHVRPGEVDDFADIFVAEPVALQVEGACLQVGAHSAVEHHDAFLSELDKGFTHEKVVLS